MEQECQSDDISLLKGMFHRMDPSELEPVRVTLMISEDSHITSEHVQTVQIQQESDMTQTPTECPADESQCTREEMDSQIITFCYKCGMCDADFTSYIKLKDHLTQSHFQNGLAISENNKKESFQRNLRHVILFTGIESFRCELCNIHFAKCDLAEKHMECHRQYQCTACEAYFEDSDSLHNHQKVCLKNAFICSICGKGYSKQSNLIRHKKMHTFKKCTFCASMFLEDGDLEEHLLTHEEYGVNMVNGRSQRSKEEDVDDSQIHLTSAFSPGLHEVQEKKQTSDVSEKSCEAEPLLQEDSETSCTEVPQMSDDDFSDLISFDHGDNVVLNDGTLKTVTEGDVDSQKKFQCRFCDQLFKGSRELKNHIRVHFKSFKCDLCEKSFKTLEELEKHEDIHENDDPLKCNVCGRRFRLNRHLKQHMKIHVEEFRCDECGEVFQAFLQLREHRRTHTTTAPFKCETCDQRFTLKKCLQKHYSLHTGEKPHQCKYCNKCFRLPSSLRHHERVHSGELPFKCDTCDKRFRLSQALKKHINTHHTAEKPYKCDICGKGFVEKGRLTAHRSRIHFGKHKNKKLSGYSDQQETESFPCLLCKEGFSDRPALDQHLSMCHPKQKDGDPGEGEKNDTSDASKLFLCVKCGKGFGTCEKLLAHMRRHGEPAWLNKSGSCRSTCHICNKTVNYLQKHLVTHTGLKPFKCDVCGKGFPERYILTKHMKSHSTVRQYECKLCNSAFKRGDNLKRHLRITHNVDTEKYNINEITLTKDKTYPCKKCDIVFTEEEEFRQHKKSHSEKVPAVCSICGKLFTNTVHLKSHMKIHANWRPYMCETCGKTFTENSQLKKHIRIHTGEKPYTCQLCDKSFSQSCSLNNHMKSHQFAGETPFKCNICAASFAFCGELEKHKKGHMGTDVFGCGLCSEKFSHPDDLKSHVDEHMGKTNTSHPVDSSSETQDMPHSQFGRSSGIVEPSITDANVTYQTETCVEYPVVTVPYSNSVDPVVTVSYSTSVDPVVTLPYHQTSFSHGPMGSFPAGPGVEQPAPLHGNTVPQTINMYHVQTLVHEAEMLIQNAHQN